MSGVAERSGPAVERRPSALKRLIGRTGYLVAGDGRLSGRIGGLVSPFVTGLRGITQGRAWRPELVETPSLDYRLIVGARAGQGSVAVSVEGDVLRIVQHVGRRVIGWGSVPLPVGVARGGAVVDASGLGDVLREAFGRLRLPRRRVVAAISGLHARASLLDLPWVKEHELDDVVADEVSRSLGVTTDDSYVFWQRLPGRRRERYVYVVALPRETLLRCLEAYEVAGLSLESLDLKPLALARAVNQRDAIVVNLERESLDVVVVVDDLPVLFRSVALPAGVIPQDALCDQGAAEVCRALATCEDAVPAGYALDRTAAIYVSGSEVGGIALAERLRSATGRPIGRPTPPMHLPTDFPLTEQLVNVGLALKQP